VYPFAAEKWSRVAPEEPMMGAEYHGIGRGSDGAVCIALRLSESPSGALYRIASVIGER
jgi:hypothetical protein